MAKPDESWAGSRQTTPLTVNQDNLTGTAGNDTFNAPAAQNGAGALINTLQNVDVLDGGAGTDTLKATLFEAAAVGATLKGIENVEVRFANAGASLSLANTTGVESVVVAESTTAGLVSNLGGVANLTVRGQNSNASFDGSTAATLNLTLDTVGKADAANTVDLGTATAAKATTLNVTANNAYVTVNSTKADVATTLSVAATGTNVLTFTDSAATAKVVTVTGAGSVNLTGAAFTAALTSFDASANTGGVKADIQSSATAAVKGGSGNDVFDMDTTVTANTTVDLGAGNDAIYVGAKLASFKSIAGGEGTDLINITDAATWTAANSKLISGFETLDVSGGKGDYDVSLGGFETVQIDEAVNGALSAATKLINAGADFTLNVMSKAKTNADFDLANTTQIVLKDATGKADSVHINVAINDGNNDGTADGNVIFKTSTTIADVENINIHSAVATIDTGLKANAYSTTFDNLIIANATTLTLTGDSDIIFTKVTNTGNTLAKVDATGSSGDITLNASAITTQIAYQGSSGVDTYKATDGGSIYGGAGNDQITLAAAGKADTIIYKSASDVSFTDTNADGKIDAGAVEAIATFTTAASAGANQADKIDLSSFGFTGYAAADAVNKGALAEALGGGNFQMQIADFFADAAGDRGVAIGTNGGNTYVFVDADGDGNWNAAADLAIQITGVVNFTINDISL
ncbi:beta strand repeat-containing protein [Castellaniella defragrans]|uniref:beta strand repeat-containing protein n=1 Tax=Castellaniella defragrans TaxID=75697 RepID=UPI0011DDD79C|nr:hypothetical protein [Castellaniella defragrans]